MGQCNNATMTEDTSYWLAFNSFDGIGPLRFKLLLEYFGTAKKAWEAGEDELVKIGLGEKLASRFDFFRQSFDISGYLKKVQEASVFVLTWEEEAYPKFLKEIGAAPPVLYLKSKSLEFLKKLFEKPCLGVVGARKITSYGRQVTESLVSDLVANGLIIISGLARGVDSVAHKTAIDDGGLTIAVLGSGVDIIYPPENKRLYQEIAENGAVISEFPLGYPAVPGNFPARNRIISGLSLGVLVTEAAEDSGALITASSAAEQGREVFAVPGPITSPLSKGTAELIKKGAKLVYNVDDILEELKISPKKLGLDKIVESMKGLKDEEKKVLELLENENLSADEIIRKTGWETAKVGSILSMMEVKGLIKGLGEGKYGI